MLPVLLLSLPHGPTCQGSSGYLQKGHAPKTKKTSINILA